MAFELKGRLKIGVCPTLLKGSLNVGYGFLISVLLYYRRVKEQVRANIGFWILNQISILKIASDSS